MLLVAAAAGLVVLGSLAALKHGALRAALIVEALGLSGLGVLGAQVLLSGSSVGAGFTSELAPSLGLDPLSGFFLTVLAVVGVPCLIFATGYLEHAVRRGPVACLTGLFIASLVLVLAARDVTTFLTGWELMTLLPAALILMTRSDRPTRRAAFIYLAVTHLGGVGVWLALLTMAHLSVVGVAGGLGTAAPGVQVAVLLAAVIGFGTKAGLMPMHSWLPRAHPVAPGHVSALMSGVMIKVAIYGLIRVLEWSGPAPLWLGLLVLALGALSAMGGVLYALFQHDLKRLLAFHSVENVGIIALGLGTSLLLSGEGQAFWAAVAFAAALLHVLNHALFKALLFLGASSIEKVAGPHDIDHLGGLLKRLPWTGGSFLVGTMSIAGLPLLNGFVSEWLTFQALIHGAFVPGLSGLACGIAAAALAGTAALAVLCFVKVSGLVLLGPPRSDSVARATEAPRSMRSALVFLAALCVVLGVVPGPLVAVLISLRLPAGSAADLFGLRLPGAGGLPALALFVLVITATGVLVRLRGSRSAALAPAWVCGQVADPSLGWTSSGFTKVLRLGWEAILRPTRELRVDRSHGATKAAYYRGDVPHLFDTVLYRPVARRSLQVAAWARRLQSGNLRGYTLYLGGTVAVILALVRAGLLGR